MNFKNINQKQMNAQSNFLNRLNRSGHIDRGFTIVELLVVIVVIGILAAITVVSYSGISNKAKIAVLQSDLSNASTQIKVFQATDANNDFPTANRCPVPGSTEICLKSSNGNSYDYTPNNASNPKTFTLDATNGAMTYRITESISPVAVTATPITAIASTTGTTTAIGNVMNAGALTPGGATASYQWQSATTVGGTYTNISGATSNTYALTIPFVGKYLKVVATGTGSYSGTQTSTASAVISDTNWLAVGSQVWAKFNMNVGTRVESYADQTSGGGVEKYCTGDTNAGCTAVDANGIAYGGLYQWPEAMQYAVTAGAQGICPTNSHIPTDNNWKILEVQLGMAQVQADATGWRGTTEGTKLKSGGISGLNIPLAGFRDTDNSFYSQSASAYLWSSGTSQLSSFDRNLSSSNTTVFRNTGNEGTGYSVRCVGN